MNNQENQQSEPAKSRFARRKPYKPRYLRPPTPEEKRKSAILQRVIAIILALMCGIGALGLVIIGGVMYHENRQLEELAELVANNAARDEHNDPSPSAPSSENDPTPGDDPILNDAPTLPTAPTEPSILPQYEQLYQTNPDLFGWLQIEDTRINYPIMHTPYDPEKYLHANFSEGYSYSGLPFLDADCTEDSDNLIIYGHHMIDGSMFTGLLNYKDKSFWETHPTIKVDTLYEEHEYEVLAAFYDRVYSKNENVFKFYQFLDVDNEQDYNDAIASIKSKQLYDTGVDASFGDQLITLVTCEYHTANGRFVVVARRVS